MGASCPRPGLRTPRSRSGLSRSASWCSTMRTMRRSGHCSPTAAPTPARLYSSARDTSDRGGLTWTKFQPVPYPLSGAAGPRRRLRPHPAPRQPAGPRPARPQHGRLRPDRLKPRRRPARRGRGHTVGDVTPARVGGSDMFPKSRRAGRHAWACSGLREPELVGSERHSATSTAATSGTSTRCPVDYAALMRDPSSGHAELADRDPGRGSAASGRSRSSAVGSPTSSRPTSCPGSASGARCTRRATELGGRLPAACVRTTRPPRGARRGRSGSRAAG